MENENINNIQINGKINGNMILMFKEVGFNNILKNFNTSYKIIRINDKYYRNYEIQKKDLDIIPDTNLSRGLLKIYGKNKKMNGVILILIIQ